MDNDLSLMNGDHQGRRASSPTTGLSFSFSGGWFPLNHLSAGPHHAFLCVILTQRTFISLNPRRSRTAVAPLERLKILMQVQNQQVYSGVFQGIKRMWETEGLRGMFKGNGANCMRIVPNSAVKFFAYEQFAAMISAYQKEKTGDPKITPLERLAAGATAGIIAMSATYSLDMVRGRLSVQDAEGSVQHYNGIFDAYRKIYREEGFRTLYKGWVPSVIGVVPYVGLNFAVYESLKALILNYYGLKDERDLSVITRLGCGAVAGTTGQTVAYPFDVARRRLQVSGWQGATSVTNGEIVYKGMMDCFIKTCRHEGWQALFHGLWPNYVKVVPSIAIAFVTYEKVKEMLGAKFRISD